MQKRHCCISWRKEPFGSLRSKSAGAKGLQVSDMLADFVRRASSVMLYNSIRCHIRGVTCSGLQVYSICQM